MFNITPLDKKHYTQWLPLWEENCRHQVTQDITSTTWQRMCDAHSAVNGLGAFDGDELVGFVHYILHPVTGHMNPVAYMQDVFTAPAHRRRGVARQLIGELAAIGRAQGWPRIYWLAEADNEAAQQLYADIGVKLKFTLHALPTAPLD